MHLAIHMVLLAGAIAGVVMATSDDWWWVEFGRVTLIVCSALIVVSTVLWVDAAATVDMPFDRQAARLDIKEANPAGDTSFLCMTHRGYYEGGACIGMKSNYWYRNVEDAKANAGRHLDKPVMMGSPRALK